MSKQGPEDSAEYKNNVEHQKRRHIELCRDCRNTIVGYHCPDSGCPWCINCGPGPVKNDK